jgi:hypothetical protein
MGAETFTSWVPRRPKDSVQAAFIEAVQQAGWQYGHDGYTGTIAEKDSFVVVGAASSFEAASQAAEKLIEEGDQRIDDKWGPAGCIEVTGEEPGYLFFGWASS